MVLLSLLEDCENCLSKGHESWKNYFSKWEELAKKEEEIPEDELVDLLEEENEEIFLKETKKKPKKQLSRKKKFKVSSCSKKVSGDKKKKKLLIENKKRGKDKSKKIIERPSKMGNENLPEETDNEQLELDLRTVIVNILKANKNKWEIFSVLSQTFSNGDVAVKSSTLVLDQPPAISFNDHRIIGGSIFSSSTPSPNTFTKECTSVWGGGNCCRGDRGIGKVNLNFLSNFTHEERFDFQRFCTRESNSALVGYKSVSNTQQNLFNNYSFEENSYSFNKFELNSRVSLESSYKPLKITRTPSQRMRYTSRFFNSCPSKKFSSHMCSFWEKKSLFKRLSPGLSSAYRIEEYNKINNEFIRRSGFHHGSDVDGSGEKSSQNLCLHKRTNDVSLNMENSNFITPKRKLPERKCLSENIFERKRRRSSKLSLFDNEDDSGSDDDRTEKRSPLIRWENKKRKSESVEINELDSSSDDECILDRIKKS